MPEEEHMVILTGEALQVTKKLAKSEGVDIDAIVGRALGLYRFIDNAKRRGDTIAIIPKRGQAQRLGGYTD